jgi:hypothetical protein
MSCIHLVAADGHCWHPIGYGYCHLLSLGSSPGYCDILMYYTPEIPSIILSPLASILHQIPKDQAHGWTLTTNFIGTFTLDAFNDLHTSNNIHRHGIVSDRLLYSAPIILSCAPCPHTNPTPYIDTILHELLDDMD